MVFQFLVAATYEGTNNTTYKGAQGEQSISITVEQSGSEVKVSYQTADGGQGKGVGKFVGARVDSLSLQSTVQSVLGRTKLR